jgi:hypothetical protein
MLVFGSSMTGAVLIAIIAVVSIWFYFGFTAAGKWSIICGGGRISVLLDDPAYHGFPEEAGFHFERRPISDEVPHLLWKPYWAWNERKFRTPLWFVFVLAIAPLIIVLVRDYSRWRRHCCIICGYPKAGHEPGVCPECGGRSNC